MTTRRHTPASWIGRWSELGRGRAWLIACVTVIAAAHALRIARTGIQLSSDSQTYSNWADALLAAGFNPVAFLGETTFVFSPIVYLLWVALIAAMKGLFGAHWTTAMVALNWAALVAVAAMVLATSRRLSHSGPAMIAAALLLLSSFELLLFVPYVLSDITFLAIATTVLVLGLHVAAPVPDVHNRRRLLTLGSVLVIVALFYRPTAPPLAVFWIAAVWLGRQRSWTNNALLRASVGAAALIIAGIAVHAAFMQDPARWPLQAGADYVARVSDEYRTGAVVFHRPATYAAPPDTYLDFVGLTVRKWLYYFSPTAPGFGIVHTVMNLALFCPAYVLGIIAVARWNDRRHIALLALYVVGFSIFHAIQKVDFDFRYRLPVVPALIIAAALGASWVLTWLRERPAMSRA